MIENCMQKIDFIKAPTYNDYVETDKITRIKAKEFIQNNFLP